MDEECGFFFFFFFSDENSEPESLCQEDVEREREKERRLFYRNVCGLCLCVCVKQTCRLRVTVRDCGLCFQVVSPTFRRCLHTAEQGYFCVVDQSCLHFPDVNKYLRKRFFQR